MFGEDYTYLDENLVEKLDTSAELYIHVKQNPEEFVKLLKDLLPIEKSTPDTWKKRVEGFYHVSECIINFIINLDSDQSWDRELIEQEADLRPLSHYHWKTGSREPVSSLMTRDGFFNDPRTSLTKLEEDIVSLSDLLRKLQKDNK